MARSFTFLVLLAAAAIFLRAAPDAPELQETRVLPVLDRLLGQTRFALFPWLPSYWLSSTLLQWSEGAFLSALFFGGVLLSHALFFGLLACTRMGGFFYDSFSLVQSRSGRMGGWRAWLGRTMPATSASPASRSPGLAEKFADLFRFVPPDRRAVMLKDARVFWRDTTQWGQTLVLFGLLAAYILNLRHLSQQLTNPFWVHLVSYLNLGACSLNLATLTTRFVFPQFSLEGKRLWVVGLAPIGLAGVVRAKLQMASAFALLLTVGLTGLACAMLKLGGPRTLYLCAAVAVMSLTLTGLAVGLGVLYPNFKEENPSKIVSGFGGTFCLVLSFLYIVASVATLAATSPWPPAGHARLIWSMVGWLVFGGTSVSSPIIASVYALAGNAKTVSYGSFPYSNTAALNDVTAGNNGT
jgi:ABC-2 type transport system permease protein